MKKNRTNKFIHPIYGELDVRYEKKRLYFKEFQIYGILFKVMDRESLKELDLIDDGGNIVLNIDDTFEYDELKYFIKHNIDDEVFQEDFLKWIKSIKRYFKGKSEAAEPCNVTADTTKASIPTQEEYYALNQKNFYRISEIGKPYNISGIKLNLVLQLEDVLIKTKNGYELAEDYKHLGQSIFVEIKNGQGEVYKQKNYVVYTDEGKEFIEGLIEKYFDINNVSDDEDDDDD